jgi:DNA-binding transcriptional ArsR family regulator
MAGIVTAGDHRALLLYLLLVTKASADPWDATLPSPVWARALGIPLPTSKTARSTVSKAWMRLERHGLVRRERANRMAKVFLLDESGSGAAYDSPATNYFRVPFALWLRGPDPGTRWYQELSLPELAVLLIARSLRGGFPLPVEKGPEWYGVSADTVGRGLAGLRSRGLLEMTERFEPAPLSATGYRTERTYALLGDFRKRPPKKTVSAAKKPTRATPKRRRSASP